jgi:hypothetical protein
MEHLLGLTRLENLNLAETKVDDAALDTLQKLKSLKTVSVQLTSVTPEGAAKLESAVQGCKVKRE